MHPLSIMIKPSSSNCDMRCKYCFYFDEARNRTVKSFGYISKETTINLIRKALDYAELPCTFAFQGGEPTLIGLDYFKFFVETVQKYNKKNIQINFAIQTNGYTITEEFAKFFHDNNFLVGLSLDGVKEVHDLNRINIQGKSTYNKIFNTLMLFKKHKVEFNILSVVTKQFAKTIEKNYNFLTKMDIRWLQFIPCLDPIESIRGTSIYSLTDKDYLEFLKKLFDIWYRDYKNNKLISIRYFDDILMLLLTGRAGSCTMQGECAIYYVIEADGEVYPCDFYMLDRYKIGNVNDIDFKKIDENRDKLNFIQSSKYKSEECVNCKWLFMCNSGCRRDKENFQTGKIGKTYLCNAFKEFFEYSYPRFREIAEDIRRRSR